MPKYLLDIKKEVVWPRRKFLLNHVHKFLKNRGQPAGIGDFGVIDDDFLKQLYLGARIKNQQDSKTNGHMFSPTAGLYRKTLDKIDKVSVPPLSSASFKMFFGQTLAIPLYATVEFFSTSLGALERFQSFLSRHCKRMATALNENDNDSVKFESDTLNDINDSIFHFWNLYSDTLITKYIDHWKAHHQSQARAKYFDPRPVYTAKAMLVLYARIMGPHIFMTFLEKFGVHRSLEDYAYDPPQSGQFNALRFMNHCCKLFTPVKANENEVGQIQYNIPDDLKAEVDALVYDHFQFNDLSWKDACELSTGPKKQDLLFTIVSKVYKYLLNNPDDQRSLLRRTVDPSPRAQKMKEARQLAKLATSKKDVEVDASMKHLIGEIYSKFDLEKKTPPRQSATPRGGKKTPPRQSATSSRGKDTVPGRSPDSNIQITSPPSVRSTLTRSAAEAARRQFPRAPDSDATEDSPKGDANYADEENTDDATAFSPNEGAQSQDISSASQGKPTHTHNHATAAAMVNPGGQPPVAKSTQTGPPFLSNAFIFLDSPQIAEQRTMSVHGIEMSTAQFFKWQFVPPCWWKVVI